MEYRVELSVVIKNRSGWHQFGKSVKLPFLPAEGMRIHLGGKCGSQVADHVSWHAEGEYFFIGMKDEKTFFNTHNSELFQYMRSLGWDHVKTY